jgi:hypothetical protein
MGMFDTVNFEMNCPRCGKLLNDFQTKDHRCALSIVDPTEITGFYNSCSCGNWISFQRVDIKLAREKAFTLEESEALGFVSNQLGE